MHTILPITKAAFAAVSLVALTTSASASPSAFQAASAAWRPDQSRAWSSIAIDAFGAIEAHTPSALAFQGGPVQTGEAVINEFMKDPSTVVDTRGEWVEIYNNRPWRLNLEGWSLSDDGGSMHVINTGGAGLRCRPGHSLVLAINGDMSLNGGVHADYVYSGFTLSNTTDQIILSRPSGAVVDRVAYDSTAWPNVPGHAICLKLAARNAISNDDGANWCAATTAISATNADTGTPGADNDACP